MPIINQRRRKQFRDRGLFDNATDYIIADAVSDTNGDLFVAPVNIPAGGGTPNPGTNAWAHHPGSEGVMGDTVTGNTLRAVYIRVDEGMTPVDPTGTWDGATLTLQGGWTEAIPSGDGVLWRADATLNNIALTATFSTPERWTGPVGPTPTNAVLNTLLMAIVDARGLQTEAEMLEAIADYLTANSYRTEAQIQDLLNEAYANVLRDLGAIQVQYSRNGIDYHDMLNVYNFVRIRLNNPDADWNIIEVGMGGSVGVGLGNQRYFVTDGNVQQVTTEITLTIPGVATYATGMKVEFEVEALATGANVTLRINALDFKRLLKFDGTEFEIGELRQGIKIEATYDGTDFVSDFGEEPHFHYVLPANVAVSADGNDYVLTDSHIIGFGVAPPALIGFRTKRSNTGPMTLIINGSTAQPLLLADGSEPTAGVLRTNQFLLLESFVVLNVTPSRSLRGQLLATCNIPVGIHPDHSIFSWTVESGVTLVTAADASANTIGNSAVVSNGLLNVPITRGNRTAQLGWYLEVTNGDTIVYDKFYTFGAYDDAPHRAIHNLTSDGLELTIVYFSAFGALPPAFLIGYQLGSTSELTIAAGNNYEAKLYLAEN